MDGARRDDSEWQHSGELLQVRENPGRTGTGGRRTPNYERGSRGADSTDGGGTAAEQLQGELRVLSDFFNFCLVNYVVENKFFKEAVEEVKFNSSMKEAAAIPYNLRCHGRVVGERYLRPRHVQLDHSSNKPLSVNHNSKKRRSRRRQKPCDPPLPECDKDEEPSLPEGGKDENPPLPEGGNDEKKERNMFVKGAKRGTEPVEEWISQANEQVLYGDYVSVSISCNETLQLWIKRLKEEEQYEVIDYRDKLCRYFGKLGYIRLMHFIAEPKYTKNMPNASEDTAKHFYARMHQMPNRETHVDYCKLYEGPPQPGLHFSQEVIPLCCETCGLKDLKALESKSMELSAEGEGRKEEYWNGYHTSTPPKIMVARRRNPEVLAEQVARRKRKR
ncbi:uncharacterized protein DS421_17g573200 [Arachis hypogaea]|nr:uncharacterized protein DS421_17g573200 [Arachis hypogaea]